MSPIQYKNYGKPLLGSNLFRSPNINAFSLIPHLLIELLKYHRHLMAFLERHQDSRNSAKRTSNTLHYIPIPKPLPQSQEL